MYFNSGNTIASVVSTDGFTWTSRQTEFSPTTLIINSVSTPVTPCNPYVYLDLYQGNLELFMLFNYRKNDGTNLVYRARLEDRVWVNGSALNILDGLTTNVPLGDTHSLMIDAPAYGIGSSDPIKVRLNFDTISPTTMEVHRQSAWVDKDNVDEVGGARNSNTYTFNRLVLNYPYMVTL